MTKIIDNHVRLIDWTVETVVIVPPDETVRPVVPNALSPELEPMKKEDLFQDD